jgi:NAD(P)-dependent dehydrogenase (short-subunit alcohol dehydrogenase family)
MTTWTAAAIPDLDGRRVVVTGANSGLGLQTSLAMARRRAAVVLAVRDASRGATAKGVIRREVPTADVEVRELDLADLSSVRAFAARWDGGLDILVNNAGVMAIPRRTTPDGFEAQFGTNHLGHFALTGLLLPALLERPGARVVTVSSGAAQMGFLRFDDLQGERLYLRWGAYAQSKLANLHFAFELDRRAKAYGLDLISVAAHPGYADTNLQANSSAGNPLKAQAFAVLNRVFAQSDADGALPQLYAATMPDVQGGEYYGPSGLFGTRGRPAKVAPPWQARDKAAAARLWDRSEDLTGVRFLDPTTP